MNERQPADTQNPPPLSRVHRARLTQIWRSAGWPHRDVLDLDLLAAGWVAQHWDALGRESLRLTTSGIERLSLSRQLNRRSVGPHDRLAERVARQLAASGRIVWRELSLRARVEHAETGEGAWRMARPDVFSVRHTSVETYLHPIVHEVKVSRADLLGDLRAPSKRLAYAWLCCECYYVFPEGIATADEIPPDFGVWVLRGDIEHGELDQLRPALHSACQLPFAVWMALARSTPTMQQTDEPAQGELGGDAD